MTCLLGASMRMGAEIPRYNLEALPDVNLHGVMLSFSQAYPSFLMIFLKQSTMPLYASSPVALLVCSCLVGLRYSHSGFGGAPSYTRVFTTSSGYLRALVTVVEIGRVTSAYMTRIYAHILC
jgi:hypothetical protein